MPATIQIISLHGATLATETQVDSGTMRFKAADNDTADANNPLVIPGAGSIYSFVKNIRFKCTVTPSNTVDNLKFYSDGGNGLGTGVDIGVKEFDPETGTATSGTSSTLTDTGKSWGSNVFTNYLVTITAGTGSGQSKTIASNTATVLTITGTFSPAPDATSVYEIRYLEPVTNAQTQVTGTASFATYTAGSPLAITGSINNPSTGLFGSVLLAQMSVASTAGQGTTPSETWTFSYDES